MRSARRWDSGARHQLFRKPLGGLDAGRFTRRPEDRQAPRLKEIENTGFERPLRPDDREINALILGEGRQLLELANTNRYAASDGSDSRISGCRKQLGFRIVAAPVPGRA